MTSKPLGDAVRRAILSAGYRNLQEFSRRNGLTYEMIRSIANEGHIPRARLLLDISRALAIDPTPLLRLAETGRRGREERRLLGETITSNIADELRVAIEDMDYHKLDESNRNFLLTLIHNLHNLPTSTADEMSRLMEHSLSNNKA